MQVPFEILMFQYVKRIKKQLILMYSFDNFIEQCIGKFEEFKFVLFKMNSNVDKTIYQGFT